jgi:hypothetical protein
MNALDLAACSVTSTDVISDDDDQSLRGASHDLPESQIGSNDIGHSWRRSLISAHRTSFTWKLSLQRCRNACAREHGWTTYPYDTTILALADKEWPCDSNDTIGLRGGS